jgi:hypothetical protein
LQPLLHHAFHYLFIDFLIPNIHVETVVERILFRDFRVFFQVLDTLEVGAKRDRARRNLPNLFRRQRGGWTVQFYSDLDILHFYVSLYVNYILDLRLLCFKCFIFYIFIPY